jgi:hypothetical protein
MDATLAIMAARPLYCALPGGLMTTHQRVRGVAAAVARDEKNTIVFERPRKARSWHTTSPSWKTQKKGKPGDTRDFDFASSSSKKSSSHRS